MSINSKNKNSVGRSVRKNDRVGDTSAKNEMFLNRIILALRD